MESWSLWLETGAKRIKEMKNARIALDSTYKNDDLPISEPILAGGYRFSRENPFGWIRVETTTRQFITHLCSKRTCEAHPEPGGDLCQKCNDSMMKNDNQFVISWDGSSQKWVRGGSLRKSSKNDISDASSGYGTATVGQTELENSGDVSMNVNAILEEDQNFEEVFSSRNKKRRQHDINGVNESDVVSMRNENVKCTVVEGFDVALAVKNTKDDVPPTSDNQFYDEIVKSVTAVGVEDVNRRKKKREKKRKVKRFDVNEFLKEVEKVSKPVT